MSADSLTHPAVLSCIERGWSVIPLVGGADAARGKTPARAWLPYRKRLPTADELHRWFDVQRYSAYGVVCGKVSGLVVLDLDDAVMAEAFIRAFPNLAGTYTVVSGNRGTPHFYFRVDFPVACQKLRGGDLKGEGGYVVGAGSVIAGREWRLTRNERVRSITHDQLEQICAFLKLPDNTPAPVCDMATGGLNASSIVDLYRREVTRSGERNNTLFRLAVQLRDSGVSQSRVEAALAEVHARKRSTHCTRAERFERRLHEAIKTIASAYSRPRRVERVADNADTSAIDNGIREALLQYADGTAFLRTYEGLRLRGVVEGQVFTRKQVCDILHGLVGEYSIKKALAMTINGHRLFALHDSTANADPDGWTENKAKRCFVTPKKPSKNGKGRPARRYLMPSVAQLRLWLGVRPHVRDPLAEADLTSAKAYRQSLERELIKRRPGRYSQAWLAYRLGVSARSIYAYHRAAAVQSVACYRTTPIDWESHERLLPPAWMAARIGLRVQGRHLEDAQGRRYPATAGTAKRLLSRCRTVFLKERTVNEYHWRDPAAFEPVTAHDQWDQAAFEAHLRAGNVRIQARFAERIVGAAVDAVPMPEPAATPDQTAWWMPQPATQDAAQVSPPMRAAQAKPKPILHTRQPSYPDALVDARDEAMAQQVYRAVRACADQRGLSLSNARCLVALYGAEVVECTLKRMLAMHQKGKIASPSGFMVVASRVKWRIEHQLEAGESAPKFRGERRIGL